MLEVKNLRTSDNGPGRKQSLMPFLDQPLRQNNL